MPPETAGEEIPASTRACQMSVPVARLMAYTLPSLDGAMSRGPAMAGDAATEPAVGKNQFSSPVAAFSARTPYGGANVTLLVVLSMPLITTNTGPSSYGPEASCTDPVACPQAKPPLFTQRRTTTPRPPDSVKVPLD